MSHRTLAEIVLDFIEFVELLDDPCLDPDAAVAQHEGIAARLIDATPAERQAVQQAAADRLATQRGEREPRGDPSLHPIAVARCALLEGIVSGETYGWPPLGAG